MATIRKRGAKYQVQVRRQGSPSVSRSFHKLSDAREFARLMETRADRGDLLPDRKEQLRTLQSVTLGDLVTRYIKEVLPRTKGYQNEKINLNAFLRHDICRIALSDLGSADFARYRDDRLQPVGASPHRRVTPKSLQRILSPVRHMLSLARDEWGYAIGENPLDKLRLKVIDNRRQRRLRDGELNRIINAAEACRNRLVLPLIRFALETAMRRGEILALLWRDVDRERGCVTIQEAKNGHSRVIPLTPPAMAVLNDLLVASGGAAAERVFPMTANGVRAAWDRLLQRAGITELNFHDLRHEAISRLFELGLTVPEVATVSGHRDMRMLFRYAHANHHLIRMKLGSVAEVTPGNRQESLRTLNIERLNR